MKKYEDKNKQNKINEIMQGRNEVSFRVLEQLEKDDILEDYDLFRIISKHFTDLFIFYRDHQYYIIDINEKEFRDIDKRLLQDRYFLLNRTITNPIQGYVQRYGTEVLDELSTEEFIQVMLRNKDTLLNKGNER